MADPVGVPPEHRVDQRDERDERDEHRDDVEREVQPFVVPVPAASITLTSVFSMST